MLEANQISPLLDNILMGEPISNHHGICCCPAVNEETGKKYIVKIISIPSSGHQLDALLLTGIVENEESAKAYFKERADDYVKELKILQELSKQEGFLPCLDWQVVSNDHGYDIYILSEYKRSLERQFTKKPFTQLDGLNLGLDMCSALTACRRNGYLFVNLKPTNIYVDNNGSYKISDLGFVKLGGLKYATIPDHCIGEYTAPEVTDAFASLNDRMDVYALGMILYRIFNGGDLPDADQLKPPAYANDALSQIILTACNSSADERWQDPAEMGQQLISYVQKNGMLDEPIVPPVPEPEPTPEIEAPEATEDADIQNDSGESEILPDPIYDQQEITPVPEPEIPVQAEQISMEEFVEQADVGQTEIFDEATEIEDIEAEISDATQLDISDTLTEPDDSQPCPAEYEGISDEAHDILAQADSLATLEAPEPAVAPDAPDIQLPQAEEQPNVPDEQNEEDEPLMEYYVDIPPEIKKSHLVRNIILVVLLLGLLVGGFLFYRFYILQTIDSLSVNGAKDQVTVTIDSEVDEKLLFVSCTKAGSASVTVPVINGEASFSGLEPNTQYNIELKINGLHILGGETAYTYYSPREIKIEDPKVLNGNVLGSAILTFTAVTDMDPNTLRWTFTYSCDGSEEQVKTFEGTTLNLTGLTEGKVYTGVLAPEQDIYICESQKIVFTPSEVIKANELSIVSCTDGKLMAQWKAPEAVTVESWVVRCYNQTNYDKTITTKATYTEFTELDSADGFTVEVSATGQSFKQTATVSANSITVSNLTGSSEQPGVIDLTWDSSAVPSNGWIITYDVSGCEGVVRVTSDSNSAQIKPAIANETYTISVRSAGDDQTLCADYEYITPDATDFVAPAGNTINKFTYTLCRQPAKEDWNYTDVVSDYTTRFKLSEEAGMVLFLDGKYASADQEISLAFVVRDSSDQLISIDSTLLNWNSMWEDKHCYLNIPKLPDAVGKYSVYVYFNGSIIANAPFTVL